MLTQLHCARIYKHYVLGLKFVYLVAITLVRVVGCLVNHSPCKFLLRHSVHIGKWVLVPQLSSHYKLATCCRSSLQARRKDQWCLLKCPDERYMSRKHFPFVMCAQIGKWLRAIHIDVAFVERDDRNTAKGSARYHAIFERARKERRVIGAPLASR